MSDQSFNPVAAARKSADMAAVIVENFISVPTWFIFLNLVGLKPGKPLQRLSEREFNASR